MCDMAIMIDHECLGVCVCVCVRVRATCRVRSWATTAVSALTTVMFLWNYRNVRGACRNVPVELP